MPKVLKIALILGLIFLSSCDVLSTTEPSEVKPNPTEVVIPEHSIPSLSPVPFIPTNTPVPPTPTLTPAPIGLNTSGPYIIFEAHNGIWVTNPDGSFPTRLLEYDITSVLDLHRFISPTGDRIALVISNDQGLDLVLIKIPGGETEMIAHLIDSPPPQDYDPTSSNSFATYAIRDYESVAWQPSDGRLLAFIGAINGPTADLYLYDTQTKEITQLTDGPSQAVLPVWSPNGEYILHFGVSWVPPFGGAIGNANRLDGAWAVRVSDGKVITLPKNEGSNPHFIGWQDDSHFITYDDGECSSENVRSVDVVSGEARPIMEASFYYYIARSPINGALLFSSAAGCPNSLGDGIFILSPGQAAPTMLHDVKAWEIDWMPESNVFDAYPEGLFSSDGGTHYDSPVYDNSFKPAVSKAGYQAWEVIENQRERVVVSVTSGDWQTILIGSVDELIWDPVDGETLLIALDDGSLYAATYPEFTPRLIGSLGNGVNQVIWSP